MPSPESSAPLCSVLIPSRARPSRLQGTVRSVRDTSPRGTTEVLVRIDDDDEATLAAVGELAGPGDVRAVAGPRGAGYGQLVTFYEELARVARGRWLWVMNDDARIEARLEDDWVGQLASVPESGVLVQPEIYQLGSSAYPKVTGGAFPIVSATTWRTFEPRPGNPIDTWLYLELCVRRGWDVQFLAGVTVVHERDPDDAIARHRIIP